MATSFIPPEVQRQFDEAGPYDPNSEVWYFGGPQVVYEGKVYRKDPGGNVDITIAGGGPGSLQQVISPTGEVLLSTTDTGVTSPLMSFAQTAFPAAIAALILGPAGTGLFSTPVAAAVGSGATTLAREGSIEEALKAAALAGAGSYAAQELFGLLGGPGGEQLAADLTVADDIAQLSQIPDITPDQIADVISQNYGIDYATASQSVANALFPEVASTLSDVGVAIPSAIPDSVTIASQPLAPIPAASTAGATLGAITGQTGATTERVPVEEQRGTSPVVPSGTIISSLLNPVPTTPERVPVEDTRIKEPTEPVGVIIPSLLAPPQTVPVQGTRIPDSEPDVTDVIIPSLLAPTVPPPVPPAPTPPPAPERVDVEGKRDRPPVFEPVFPVIPPIVPPGVPPLTPTAPPAPPSILDDLKPLLPLVPLVGGLLPTDEQKRIDNIINFPIPDYRFDGSKFVPYSNYFQIAPTDVYNYFATTAPFGAGRFGAVAQPITVPGGLLSTQ